MIFADKEVAERLEAAEAYAVLSRASKEQSQILVLASAGNTAAAFARTCSENGIRCVIVVPAAGMQRMRFATRLNYCVKIICLTGSADYADAISFAERISRSNGFYSEGGVRNIGRRDGIGAAPAAAVHADGVAGPCPRRRPTPPITPFRPPPGRAK